MIETKPRKPWIALTMSAVLPGFGQLYNGELNKAIWLFLGFALLSVPAIAFATLYLPGGWMMPALAASLLVTLGLWVFGMADAWRRARHLQNYRPEHWQMSGIYMLVLLLCNFVSLPLLTHYVRGHLVEAFRIPSTSMEPTVLKGDFLFADKRYNCPGCKGGIHRGDIAIFTYPNNRTLLYIKRIIALPGDHVRLRGGEVAVNGKPLATGPNTESEDGRSWHTIPAPAKASTTADQLVVPPGQVFVLGDNRGDSVDSRVFGTVPMEDVVGKARQVWFSIGKQGVRWHRLGARLNVR